MDLINWVSANWAQIGVAVLAVVGAASAIAKLTPTTHDDEIVQKILDFLNALALNKKPEAK